MATTNDFRNGMYFGYDGDILGVIEFLHVKPGKGPAFVRAKVRNMRTGSLVERTFRGGEKIEELKLRSRKMEYLYNDGDNYVFMDQENYEQVEVPSARLGDKVRLLSENLAIDILMHEGEILGIDLPQFMEIKISYTEPGEKGNTVSGTTKKAELVGGAIVQVPLFVETGTVIKIDTNDMRYIERVSK